jgi:hypothetical protein
MNALPFVKPEICYSVEQECLNIPDKVFAKKIYKKLKKTNPIVALWIKKYAKTTKDPLATMICSLIVYRLLESQSESDSLGEYF